MSNWMKRVASVLVVVLLMVGAFYVGTSVIATRAGNQIVWDSAARAVVTPPADASITEQQFAALYNQISQSVVSINVVQRIDGMVRGFDEEGFAEGTGTGFVIDTQGHIVTNNHVVDGAELIEVNFFDGTITRGEVVGLDPDSDVAVIKVNLPADQLFPVTFANSDELYIGETTIAIGSPFNQPWTMTTGIISALNRTIQGLTQYSIGEVIQTDAAINPGNSGGPLLNLRGEVIGINSQIISQSRSSSGVGFAIPSNLVQRVVPTLIAEGEVDYSYLGIAGGDIRLLQQEALGLPNDAQGVVVQRVEPNSPAASAGLRNPGDADTIDGIPVYTAVDIITAIDGQPVNNMASLISYLASSTEPGQQITLTIVRNGSQQLDLTTTLVARPD